MLAFLPPRVMLSWIYEMISYGDWEVASCCSSSLWVSLFLVKVHVSFWDVAVDTGATPKTPAAPVTKNINPMYSPEIHGWDFSWLELLEWLVALQPTTLANPVFPENT